LIISGPFLTKGADGLFIDIVHIHNIIPKIEAI